MRASWVCGATMTLKVKGFTRLTIKARVAFVIYLADSLLNDLDADEQGRKIAERALGMASVWLKGEPVDGEQLNSLLLDENDEGIFIYVDSRDPKATDAAYNVIGGAITYTAWQAYRASGVVVLPEGIEEVTEEFVGWILAEATKAESFNPNDTQRAHDFLLSRYPIKGSDELGDIVDLKQMIATLQRQST